MAGPFAPHSAPALRRPAVEGAFYPADPAELDALIDGCVAEAAPLVARAGRAAASGRDLAGVLVPHAGLVYSGVVAAAGWLAVRASEPDVVVLLGTNHGAAWLDGVGAWETGAWQTPSGRTMIDEPTATAILALGPPFTVDRAAHLGEHSIEVQLPFLGRLLPNARIVPLAVSAGVGQPAREAGRRLGGLLGRQRGAGRRIVIAISSDMAHYPVDGVCRRVTRDLLPSLERIRPEALAATERRVVADGRPSVVCGMCGIEPAVLGLAALEAMGATGGVTLAAATSADVGGPADRTVGYLAMSFR